MDNDACCAAMKGIIRVRNKNDDLCFAKPFNKGMYRQSGPINHSQQASIQNENNILGKLAKDLCNIRSFNIHKN